MANDDRPVVMTIPEDMMRATIHAAVAQALANGKPERFIEELVRNVLNKQDSNYGRQTVLDATITGMIKSVAEEFCREYVETLRPQIREAVEARLKNKKKFASEIADKLVDSISGSIRASISIDVRSADR
jgi:uncharacterized membrane-anchored protein YjiN (DUF445 family)